ncbi:MAG TPA: glycosyltransferase family 2 protein [Candidatus Limnocylindria bacterium]|nr:glycosyltransferase family 2 protein [Candidatus Limnocylindria bacterium]
MPLEVSIVVPLFNEAENVEPLVKEIDRIFSASRFTWELVLVDDGSKDSTWQCVRDAASANAHVRGLRHLGNRGQSAAVWTGITGSVAPYICTLDGDLQNDPVELPRMLDMLGKFDFVSGHRVDRQDTWVRKMSSLVARRVRMWALRSDFADTGCALRAFRRSALNGVFAFNGLHRFLPILVAGNGSRAIEVPVRHRERVAGVSKYGVWNRLGRGIWDLMAMAWYQRRRIAPVEIERVSGPTGEVSKG